MNNKRKLIGPFSQLVTMTGLSTKGPLNDTHLLIIENGGLMVNAGVIEKVGRYKELKSYLGKSDELVDVEGDTVCLPGLVDAHTHICFAGSRAGDYAARNSGKTYLEIAESGGGIWSSVKATRKANEEDLVNGIINRASRHLQHGITTIEIKSGYGLDCENELKMLRAIKNANAVLSNDVIPSCLAAHTIPKDFHGTEDQYLNMLLNELLPVVTRENLSDRVDIFIEKGSFSPAAAKRYLEECRKRGFKITVHADQFTTGGSEVAVEVGALSADHLEASTSKEIDIIARSNTIAIALPGASLGLGCGFTPARKLLDAGACLAIASDWNPGSAPMGNLLMQAAILGTFEKLSSAEVLAGITRRAAMALGLSDRGDLNEGKLADFIIFPTKDFREILYHQGMMAPIQIWKNGNRL